MICALVQFSGISPKGPMRKKQKNISARFRKTPRKLHNCTRTGGPAGNRPPCGAGVAWLHP
jgi:hypothetical protein